MNNNVVRYFPKETKRPRVWLRTRRGMNVRSKLPYRHLVQLREVYHLLWQTIGSGVNIPESYP